MTPPYAVYEGRELIEVRSNLTDRDIVRLKNDGKTIHRINEITAQILREDNKPRRVIS